MKNQFKKLLAAAKNELCRTDCTDPGTGCCKPNLSEAVREAEQTLRASQNKSSTRKDTNP